MGDPGWHLNLDPVHDGSITVKHWKGKGEVLLLITGSLLAEFILGCLITLLSALIHQVI